MIYCYICPLKDVCRVPKVQKEEERSLFPHLPITLNWLPNGAEDMCPLYKAANEASKNSD